MDYYTVSNKYCYLHFSFKVIITVIILLVLFFNVAPVATVVVVVVAAVVEVALSPDDDLPPVRVHVAVGAAPLAVRARRHLLHRGPRA